MFNEINHHPNHANEKPQHSEWTNYGGASHNAYGYAQALDGTWVRYKNETGRPPGKKLVGAVAKLQGSAG